MTNKIWKKYVDEIHNQDANFEKIRLRTKGVMNMKKKLLNGSGFCCNCGNWGDF